MKSFINEIKEKFNELEDEELDEANVTSNLDGGQGPPRTPYAFSKNKDEDDLDTKGSKNMGYTKAKKTNKHRIALEALETKLENQINEISYKEFKKDDSRKQYQKVNDSIKKMNRMMYEMERVVNQNIKLKNEAGVNNGQYWKSTQKRLVKISERLKLVSNKIKELGA